MKSLIIFFVLFAFVTTNLSVPEEIPKEQKELIREFIEAVKNDDRDAVVGMIQYPLDRRYPLPDIEDEIGMLERYEQVFDSTLLRMISNSTVDSNWTSMGWRGIMLDQGSIWFSGKIIAVNYHSDNELSKRKEILEEERKMLDKSVEHEKSGKLISLDKIKNVRNKAR